MTDIRDPKPISGCLQQGSALSQIVQQARAIAAADEALQSVLPAELAPHCHVINLRAETLIVATDSAAWATRLRYLAPSVLESLHQLATPLMVQVIRCRVN